MDFFEKLTESFAKNSKEFADKAKDYAEVAKLHARINAANAKINDSLITLGKAYYDAHKNDSDTEFQSLFEEIRKAHQTIKKCQEEIQKIKNIKICEKCGKEVSADAIYCSHCGAKLQNSDYNAAKQTDEPDVDVENVDVKENSEQSSQDTASDQSQPQQRTKICPSCGQELEEDAEYCTKCGSSMK